VVECEKETLQLVKATAGGCWGASGEVAHYHHHYPRHEIRFHLRKLGLRVGFLIPMCSRGLGYLSPTLP